MPANLTPQYLKAEEEYRKAQTPQEEIECLEKMMQLIPKHKGTEKLRADLKTRLKETKSQVAEAKRAPKKGRSTKIPRQGAGQVVLVGGPNAGKSRILAELTNANPTVADYPFSTHEPMPGMMAWEDVFVQLIDTPPITADHIEASIPNIVRSADEVLLCMDGSSDDGPDQTADVIVQLKQRKTLLDTTTGFDEEQFALLRIKTLLAVTRADDPGCADRVAYFREMVPTAYPMILVELDRRGSVEELRSKIYATLNVIRIYTKAPGKPADFTDPFTLPAGGTVEDLAAKVHRDLPGKVKFAKVWGDGFHDGQSVGLDVPLYDRNLVELHT